MSTQATVPYAYPSFLHYREQGIAHEVARFERAAKKTAMSAPPAEQRAKTTDATRTLVAAYLAALNHSRADRMAAAHAKAIKPWPRYGFDGGDAAPAHDTASPLDAIVTSILEKKERVGPVQNDSDPSGNTDDESTDEYINRTADKDAVYVSSKNKYRRIPTNKQVTYAYVAYVKGQDPKAEKLFDVVSRFAVGVVAVKFSETNYPTGDIEDVAQELVMRVADKIDDFVPKNDDPRMFYWWLDRVVKHAYCDAFNAAKATSRTDVPLFVDGGTKEEVGEIGGTDSGGSEVENPGMYGRSDVGSSSKSHRVQNPRKYSLVIPEFIQGVDLEICQWMREGYDYADIGRTLEITEKAVERRVANIRKKVKELGLKKKFA